MSDEHHASDLSLREQKNHQTSAKGLDAVKLLFEQISSEDNFVLVDKFLAERFIIFRAYATHEDGLINNRISWFIQLHSFLIAAFGLIASAGINGVLSEKVTHPTSYGWSMLAFVSVLAGISVVGFWTCRSTRKSVKAAFNAIKTLNEDWNYICRSLIDRISLSEEPLNRSLSSPAYPALPGFIGGGKSYNVDEGLELAIKLPQSLKNLWAMSLIIPIFLLCIPNNAIQQNAIDIMTSEIRGAFKIDHSGNRNTSHIRE